MPVGTAAAPGRAEQETTQADAAAGAGLGLTPTSASSAPADYYTATHDDSPTTSECDATLTPVLSANWGNSTAWTIGAYRQSGGYRALPKAVAMGSAAVVDEVKDSACRGRGGRGLPDGREVGLPPAARRGAPLPRGERRRVRARHVPFMMADPHLLVEGVIVS